MHITGGKNIEWTCSDNLHFFPWLWDGNLTGKNLREQILSCKSTIPASESKLQPSHLFHSIPGWPGLGLPRPKAIVVIPKNQPLPKHLREKTSKRAKHACQYVTKERPVKITMYLGLNIIIKIKFTTILVDVQY